MSRFITVFFLLGFAGFARAGNASSQKDTIKVPVKVIIKERQVNQINFDSLFRTMSSSIPASPLIRPSRFNKRNTLSEQVISNISTGATASETDSAMIGITQRRKANTKSSISVQMSLKDFMDWQKSGPKGSTQQIRISFAWIGFVLILGGIVLGIIFGRYAFLTSLLGVIFLLIDYLKQ